ATRPVLVEQDLRARRLSEPGQDRQSDLKQGAEIILKRLRRWASGAQGLKRAPPVLEVIQQGRAESEQAARRGRQERPAKESGPEMEQQIDRDWQDVNDSEQMDPEQHSSDQSAQAEPPAEPGGCPRHPGRQKKERFAKCEQFDVAASGFETPEGEKRRRQR